MNDIFIIKLRKIFLSALLNCECICICHIYQSINSFISKLKKTIRRLRRNAKGSEVENYMKKLLTIHESHRRISDICLSGYDSPLEVC